MCFVLLSVYANGRSFDAPFRISLNARVMRKWDLVLKEIGERIKDIVPKTQVSKFFHSVFVIEYFLLFQVEELKSVTWKSLHAKENKFVARCSYSS